MMKYFYLKVILAGLVSIFSMTAKAQLHPTTPIYIETIVHHGNYGEAGMNLDGYVTYKVYVQFANPDNFLTSIFATEYIPDCAQDADSSLFMNFPCGLFQHPQGSAFGFQSACQTGTYPTVAYDSYLTIGKSCASQVTCDIITPLNQCPAWQTAFEGPANGDYFDGGNFFWDDGAIYNAVCNSPYPTSLGHADANGRVLIGQFTTCGDMNGCINLTYRTQAQVMAGGTAFEDEYNVCFSAEHPCLANLMDNTPVVGTLNCTSAVEVTLDGGGNGSIDYNLYDVSDVLISTHPSQSSGLSLTSLPAGDYYITMEDEAGCRDTTAVFNVEASQEFTLNPTVVDASCFGLCDGSISYDVQGGVDPYTFSVNGGGTINALCAGSYVITITDGNGCQFTNNQTVGQPADITFSSSTTPESCGGLCDGEVALSLVSGGAGGFTYTLTPSSGSCVSPCSGPAVTFDQLCSGTYSIMIMDADGCQKNVPNLVLTPPAPLVILFNPTNVSCFGGNNGSVLITHQGGTGVATVTPGGAPTPYTAGSLMAGTHTFTITDEGGCTATGDVIISEPQQLVAVITDTTHARCYGNCNGIVQYQITGGTSPYSYLLNPLGITGPASATGAISSLCANDYIMTVRDLNNCTATVEFEVFQPQQLQITPILNAPTCTGMTDGDVELLLSGGSGSYTFFVNPQTLGATQVDPTTYTIDELGQVVMFFELIDSEQCVLLDTLIVLPDIISDMVLTRFSSPETCWNERDGTATIGVQGGHLPISYLWDDPNNQITPTADGLSSNLTYTVIVTDAIGCTLTDTVFVSPTVGCFFISNALTPNGDGYNDVWVLGGLEYFPDCVVNVYNRWGQNLYSSVGYLTPWNGLFKGEMLPAADYYYTIEYDKTKSPINGTVTLKY